MCNSLILMYLPVGAIVLMALGVVAPLIAVYLLKDLPAHLLQLWKKINR